MEAERQQQQKEEFVVLVDEQDKEIGTIEKLQAHTEGRLHRAISIFVFNSKNELLLQQRAQGKYHSSDLWSNTCCSHPRPGESNEAAAHRRLVEEMGMDCKLSEVFSFIYRAKLDNNITEYEYDHVFTGTTDALPVPNALEAAGWKYMSIDELEHDMEERPALYTEWFKICLKEHKAKLLSGKS